MTVPIWTHTFVLPPVMFLIVSVQSMRSSFRLGAKNQTAAGVWILIASKAAFKFAPQLMKPTPIGRMVGSPPLIGLFCSKFLALSSSALRSLVSVPAARKPKPPAFVTATASGARAIKRIGALTMIGLHTHGYARFIALSMLLGRFSLEVPDNMQFERCSELPRPFYKGERHNKIE